MKQNVRSQPILTAFIVFTMFCQLIKEFGWNTELGLGCRLFSEKATGNWPKDKGVSFQYNGEVEGAAWWRPSRMLG